MRLTRRVVLLAVTGLLAACETGQLHSDRASPDGGLAASREGGDGGPAGAAHDGAPGPRADGGPDVRCGDGVVGEGETCDPPGSCPTTCDDGVACTRDVLYGDPESCYVTCGVVPIAECVDGDGCCASGCDSTTDSDCSASCGNGVVEEGETCDPPGSCPTTCDDGRACTADLATGSAETCSAACSVSEITACTGGDGCCPSGCNATNDDDCSPVCGNGVVESGETCDPAGSCPSSCDDGRACTTDTRTGSTSSCDVRCSHSRISSCRGGDGCCPSGCHAGNDSDCPEVCGDGACTSGEDCSSCSSDCGSCRCGDGWCTVGRGELCTTCAADCDTRSNVCGNGECQSGENSSNCGADCGRGSWPSGWASREVEVMNLINEHRAAGTDCPSGPKGRVGPVSMQSRLRKASRLHSWDQSYSDYFSHTSCNGRSFTDRARAQGTTAGGEIIAWNTTSPSTAVSLWMRSTTGHCDAIMNGSFTRIGVGFANPSVGDPLFTAMFR